MDFFLRDLISNNFAQGALATFFFAILMLWSFFWKGMGLWYSAQNKDKYWFAAILILNTAGVIEIFYLFIYSKNKITIKSLKADITKFLKSRKFALASRK